MDEFKKSAASASSSTAKFATTLKSVAANIGIMLAINAVIKLATYSWDKANTTVSEVKERIDELSNSISTLESEYNSLLETGKVNLTDAEKDRLDYLESRIKREKELKELEEARLIREKYGSKFTDYFDEDNYNKKFSDFRSKYFNSKQKFDIVSMGVESGVQLGIDEGSKIDEYNKAKSRLDKILEDLQNPNIINKSRNIGKEQAEKELDELTSELKLEYENYKQAKYEAEIAIEEMTADLDNPNLTQKDRQMIQDWISQYQGVINVADYYINLLKDIPAVSTYSDTDSYHNWYSELSDEEKKFVDSDDFRKALDEESKKLDGAALSAKNYETALEAVKNSQNDTTNVLENAKLKMIDLINSMSDGFDVLDDIYADVLDGGSFDFTKLDSKKFEEQFKGLEDEYVSFIEKVSDSPTDINACQDAFNELATAYIKHKGILNSLTDENAQLTISMLTNMGITNAETVVTEALKKKKAKLAAEEQFLIAQKEKDSITSRNLTSATYDEIKALISYGYVTEETESYLSRLALSKLDVINTKINSDEDIDNIIALADAAGTSEEYVNALRTALVNLQNAQNKVNNASKSKERGAAGGLLAAVGEEAIAEAEVNKMLSDFEKNIAEFKLDPSTFYAGGKNSQSAREKAEKDAKSSKKIIDWIETAISRLQRAITNLGKTVSATYKKWSIRNNALAQEFAAVRKEIELQQQAYDGYIAKANSIPLSEGYKQLVRDGAIKIEDITDEDLQEQIESYKEW